MINTILRPQFTENIYKYYIQKGKSLNIFGAKGVGKSRFIEDLKSLIDYEINFVSLNMRELRTNYKRFTRKLKDELNIEGEANTIELVLAEFAKKSGKKVLVIDHFEYLFEANHDRAFNFDFFDQLNSFKNSDSVSLLILSTHNYTHEQFYKDGELTTSPLDISVEEITPLIQKEIEDELKREIDKDLNFELLATLIMGKEHPYDLMNFVAKEIKFSSYNSRDSLEKNFDRWEKKYSKINSEWALRLKSYLIKNKKKLTELIFKGVELWFKKKID